MCGSRSRNWRTIGGCFLGVARITIGRGRHVRKDGLAWLIHARRGHVKCNSRPSTFGNRRLPSSDSQSPASLRHQLSAVRRYGQGAHSLKRRCRNVILEEGGPIFHVCRFVQAFPGKKLLVFAIWKRRRSAAQRPKGSALPITVGTPLEFCRSGIRTIDSLENPVSQMICPIQVRTVAFVSLVKIAGGDVPPGAVKAELLAAGAVVELESGMLKALKRHFVPGSVDEKLVFGLTHILFPVLEGMARNTSGVAKEPWVQRLAYSRRLLPSALPLFRHIARERCGDFVQSVDDWLVSHEADREAERGPVMSVGVGVFYFEDTELVQTQSETQATEL